MSDATLILETPEARLIRQQTPEGWAVRAEEDAWKNVARALNALTEEGAPDFNVGMAARADEVLLAPVAPASVPAELQEYWRERYGVAEGDELKFVRVSGPDAPPLVLPYRAVGDAIHLIRDLQIRESTARAWRHLQVRAVALVEAIAPEFDLAAAELSPGDEDRLRALEAEARRLDKLERARKDDTPDPEIETIRESLLYDLQATGVLLLDAREVRTGHLQRLELKRLLGYHRAAVDLDRYLRSDERQRYLPDAVVVPPLAAFVSVDWFRLGPWAYPKIAPLDWLAWCEKTLLEHREPPTTASWQYSTEYATTLAWRIEHGFLPALVSAGEVVARVGVPGRPNEGPLDPGPELELAALHTLEQGAPDLAVALLALRVGAVPEAANAWYGLGNAMLLLAVGPDRADIVGLALACLNRALREDPKHEPARHLRYVAANSAEALGLPLEFAFIGDVQALMTAVKVSIPTLPLLLATVSAQLRDRVLMALANQDDARLAPTLSAGLVSDVGPFIRTYLVKRIARHRDVPGVRATLEHLAKTGLYQETGPHFAAALREIDPAWAEKVLASARTGRAEPGLPLDLAYAQQMLRVADAEANPPPPRKWWKFW